MEKVSRVVYDEELRGWAYIHRDKLGKETWYTYPITLFGEMISKMKAVAHMACGK